MGEPFVAGNNFSLSLHPDSEQLADKLFKNLSADGKVIVPMSKVPWGDYFGMFIDKFGIKWMINHQAKSFKERFGLMHFNVNVAELKKKERPCFKLLLLPVKKSLV